MDGDYIVLSVSDSDAGIKPENQNRIVDRFYTKKVMGRSGTGLGMAVVWGMVKDYKGYINIQSKEGIGTTFKLYFPVSRDEPSSKGISFSIQDLQGNGETILIVDDVEEQPKIASAILKKLDYSAKTVCCGEEAVEYIKKNAVDLVLLDMIMDPGMNGLDTYKCILEVHPQQKAITQLRKHRIKQNISELNIT